MKVFIALGSLIVLSLLALLVGPLFIDWTAYRTQFEAEASRLLGQRVEVRGTASARLLPFPSVTFGDVVVGEPTDPVLSIRSFRMDAELAPYLSGEVRIFDMRLDSPHLSVPIQADGTIRWPLSQGALADGASVILEHVAISSGSILLEDRRTARMLQLENIDAQFAAQSLVGPFSGTATLAAEGEPLALTVSTGQVDGSGAFPVRITATSAQNDVSAALDAVLTGGGDRPLVDGKLLLLSPAAPVPEGNPVPGARAPVRATAAVKMTAADATLSDLRIEVGGTPQPYVVEGSADFAIGAIPHFDVTLRGQATDFDRVAPPAGTATPSFQDRLASLRTLAQRLPVFDIPGRVQASLPLLTIGDTALRDVSFVGSPTADGWSIESMAAELPGRSRLQASGIARLRDHASFKGSLLLAVRQPAAFFTWAGLGESADLVALSRAGFSAEVDLSSDTQRLEELEVDLDGGTLNGSLQRTVRPEGTVNLVDLKGGRIDLRPLAAVARALPNTSTAASERFDVQFDAGPVSFGSYGAQHLAADFSLQDGTLDVADITADDFAGASLHGEGTIDDVFGAPRPDLSIDLLAQSPSRLLTLTREIAPDSPLIATLLARGDVLAPVTLAGTLASPPGEQTRDLLLALSGTVGGTTVDLRLALENGLAAQSLNGRFGFDATLQNDDPTVLLAQLGRRALAIGDLAPLRVTVSASGTPDKPIAVTASATAGETALSIDGSVTLDPTGIASTDSRLRLSSDDAAPWATALGIPAGQGIERVPVQLGGQFVWSPAGWRLSELQGRVSDANLTASFDAPAGETLRGEASVSAISDSWVRRVLLGVDAPGEDAPFGAALLPGRAFEVDLRIDEIEGAAASRAKDLRLHVSGDGSGLVRATGLTGQVGATRIAGEGQLRNVDGLVSVGAKGALEGLDLSHGTTLNGRARADVRISGAGRSEREILASLDGDGTIDLTDAKVRGISPDVMTPLTLAADSQTAALDADTVSTIVRETGEGAAYPLGALTIPFQIGAGTLRAGPIRATGSSASLEGDINVVLATGALGGELALRPKIAETLPDAEPPKLTYRIMGTVAAPVLEARTEALTSYFGVRAFQLEQARVEALREELSETARLRREARLYRERAAIREELRNRRLEAEEAERQRKDAEAAAERSAREAAAREAARIRAQTAIEPPIAMPDLSSPVVPVPPALPSAVPGLSGAPQF